MRISRDSLFQRTARVCVLGGSALSVLVLSFGALAQSPREPTPSTSPEVMELPSENPAPTPDSSTGDAKPKEPLSKELKEGEGVLEPPHGIDPEIQKNLPEDFEGRTPVIPPPGEPGGRQDVQPK